MRPEPSCHLSPRPKTGPGGEGWSSVPGIRLKPASLMSGGEGVLLFPEIGFHVISTKVPSFEQDKG